MEEDNSNQGLGGINKIADNNFSSNKLKIENKTTADDKSNKIIKNNININNNQIKTNYDSINFNEKLKNFKNPNLNYLENINNFKNTSTNNIVTDYLFNNIPQNLMSLDGNISLHNLQPINTYMNFPHNLINQKEVLNYNDNRNFNAPLSLANIEINKDIQINQRIDANYLHNNYLNCNIIPNSNVIENIQNMPLPYHISSVPNNPKKFNLKQKNHMFNYSPRLNTNNSMRGNNTNNLNIFSEDIIGNNFSKMIKEPELDKETVKKNSISNTVVSKGVDTIRDLENFLKYIKSLPIELVNFLCTQKGTIEIQKRLNKGNIDCKIALIKILHRQGLSKIMKNTYGNYFIQQIVKDEEKGLVGLILHYIYEDFVNISKDPSGTFVLQALISEISSEEEEMLVLDSIRYHELEMVYNKNATHVLQKILCVIPDKNRLFLNEIILNNTKELALDCNGICLLKKFISTITIPNNKKKLNDIVVKNCNVLAQSPYGNYGIQFLFEKWDLVELEQLNNKIIENIEKLSSQQYSSNVVEKAIEIFDEKSREKLIRKLCFNCSIISLLKNKYGRFVLYKAIKYMNKDMKNELESFLTNNKNEIINNKDKTKLKKFILKLKSNDNINHNLININNDNNSNNININGNTISNDILYSNFNSSVNKNRINMEDNN